MIDTEKHLRHLLFHLTPLATAAAQRCWRWHLRQINHYAHIFDGQLIFAVNIGDGMVPVEEVASLLPPHAQIIAVANHPTLREVYTFPLLLAKTFSLSPRDTVFYAHGKGVSWIGHEFETTTRWWSLAMYRFLLSDPALTGSLNHPILGWLKYDGPPPPYFPAWSKWHYVGTFFWFRAADVYARPWWFIIPEKYGAEAYLSGMFTSEKAACGYTVNHLQHFSPDTPVVRIYFKQFWESIGIPIGPDAQSYDGTPV